uniref:Uncharacterized protein n=1 Tax=Aegilops tauschii subsp. strangulata TaxID=200361 RepID=A0A453CW14_AEGTS
MPEFAFVPEKKLTELLCAPSVHKHNMFWISQYGLHTDWNE